MVTPQFVAETLVELERLGAQPTLNIFDGTVSLAGRGRLPPLAAGAPRPALEAYRAELIPRNLGRGDERLAGAAGVSLRGRSATIDEASEDGSRAAPGSRASELDDAEAPEDDARYDVFVSHCKRLDASEDRAVWVADVCEGAGLKVFFDRSDLTDISTEALERGVKQSRCLVTVLDPYTFESVWCVRENRWAAAAGRPIVPLYDGDRHRWDTIKKWCGGHPHVFAKQAINYNKDYRTESKLRLLDAVRRALAEGRAVERPQIAHTTSSHTLAKSAASVRIGVAKSQKPLTADATEAALRQLASKLGGATPDVVLVVLCGGTPTEPSPYDLDVCLARLRVGEHALGEATKVVATTSALGIAVESQWVGGHAIALFGICDPEGSYEVCYADASQGSEVVRERIAAAAARAGRDEPPTVSIVLTTAGTETTSLRGIQAALGEAAHLVGGTPSWANPPGLAISPGGGGRDESATSGVAMLLCWPNATVASAFVSGAGDPPAGEGQPERPRASAPAAEGVITDLYTSERGSVIVKTIDGKPASEVWLSWLPEEAAVALRPWVDDFDNQAPLGNAPAWAMWCAQNPMGIQRAAGVVMVAVMGIRGGELEFLTGVEVDAGEVLFPQFVDKTTICEKTHEAAKQVCAKQALSTDDIRGAFTFGCGINVVLGEADGIQDVSDKMACALGSAPLFGMVGGPELGHAHGDKASFACVMYSCLVFQ